MVIIRKKKDTLLERTLEGGQDRRKKVTVACAQPLESSGTLSVPHLGAIMELVPSYPTSPRYFATFDFIRPVRAVTVNFMDRSRSRQAGTRKWVDPAWKTRTTRADPPPCSSFPFFLNRRNGKSSPIFLSFSRLAKEASCQLLL